MQIATSKGEARRAMGEGDGRRAMVEGEWRRDRDQLLGPSPFARPLCPSPFALRPFVDRSVDGPAARCRRPMADVRVHDEGAVRVLTLDRPDVYNAFTLAAIRELRARVEEAVAEPRVRALVLTG